METCVRGFSFMPKPKVEGLDLKYVESEALERTWRITRRERLKQQEQKIWEEFVQEQDIVHNISKEDPYQFLNQLPEECIQELLKKELYKMQQEKGEDIQIEEQPRQPNSMLVEADNQHVVTFSEVVETEESDMFNIFDDEKDADVSGPEEENLNDSIDSAPCTVRERPAEERDQSPEQHHQSPDKVSSKSSTENVTNMIECSIYCAKVKDLRTKINDELFNIIGFLENQDIINIEPSEIPKLMKRSVEFCARFSRVHLYQLHRQVGDIERNTSNAPPFAQRTHFQAQLVRVTSLHQNLCHALQIFHKSLQQTACIKESAELLRSLLRLLGDVTRACGDVTRASSAALPASIDLYNDDIQATCVRLEETLNVYSAKVSDFLNSTENTSISCSRKSSKIKGRKNSVGTWSKSGTNKSSANTEGRLSMYSLGTQRTGPRDNHSCSGTSKIRPTVERTKPVSSKEEPPKSPKKTPRSRRPLMRAPQRNRPRHQPRELDVHTLVENVAPCTSSHISREVSPLPSLKSKCVTPRQRSKETTPRTPRPNEEDNRRNRTPLATPRNKSNTKNKMAPMIPMKTLSPNKATSKDRKETPSGNCSPKEKGQVANKEMENMKLHVKERDERREFSQSQKVEADLKHPWAEETKKSERDKIKADAEPTSCEVTRLVRQLCGGDSLGNRGERVTGAKNAQLLCINGGSPRQPSTPQLLRILEETIQKKAPKSLFPKQTIPIKDAEKYRMTFNVPEQVTDSLFQYRTKFVQHMLTSSMYANSAVGKPWEKIGSVSEQIIDDLLLNCAKEMELQQLVKEMYKNETR